MLRAKGHKPLGFQILVPIMWFGGEFGGAIAFALLDPTVLKDGFNLIVYLGALVTAVFLVGVLFIIAHFLEPRQTVGNG